MNKGIEEDFLDVFQGIEDLRSQRNRPCVMPEILLRPYVQQQPSKLWVRSSNPLERVNLFL